MKLTSIRLCNFRPFYSKTPEIVLASREDRNTTVIHGNNGGGKTSLLNALTWVLYEKFTAAFASPEQLVNKRAIAEAKPGEPVECWVEVAFEHNGKRYRAKRVCHAYKTDTGVEQGRSELLLQVAGNDGRWTQPPQASKDVINRVLPESLHRYFFFDGERIEKIVQSDKKAEMAAATKVLLRVEVLDRAIRHLGEAKKALEQELAEIGDPETQRLIQEKNQLEQEQDRLKKRQNEISQELAAQNTLEKNLGDQLRELNSVRDLQKERDKLQEEAKSIQAKINQGKNRLRQVTSTKSYAVFLSEATADFRAILDDLRERGELPAGIKQQFVKDLLHQKRCICGTKLTEGTQSYKLVQTWMDKAGRGDVEETAIRMGAQIEAIDKQIPEFWKELNDEQNNIGQLTKSLSLIENKLEDIHENLINSPVENIRDLEGRLETIKNKIRDLTLEEGENNTRIADLGTEISRKGKIIDQHQMNESKQLIAQERIRVTQDAIDRLMDVRATIDQQFRSELEISVQKIFRQISFKPYVPKLSDKYELTLIESTAGREQLVPASSGESVILSLSFIGSIIDKVREWSKKQTLIDLGSSIFPVVMDSPFAVLDIEYKQQIARTIPKLANQLILLVNKSQWMNEVEQEMNNYMGKQYVLTYYSPKEDCKEDSIELAGHNYPLVEQSPYEFEYTTICEVGRHS